MNQDFIPTTPKRKQLRCQMDLAPSGCACISILTNVVFIFDGFKEHYSDGFVKKILRGVNCVFRG
ncbi:MAG TPA: hypothetical protein VHG71_00110 [Verrucomicrobiae bacterium]|nr:hypothetical protein [Verrucomicrobiae bacterium]